MTANNETGTAQETYTKFLSLLKVGTILTIGVTILVVILIS